MIYFSGMKKYFVFGFFCLVALSGCNQSGCTDPLAANYEVKATTDDGSCVYLAEIGTSPIINVSSQSFNSGGVITSDGGQDITVRGVCWSTSPNPTTANDTTINGFGTGVFTSFVTGLQSVTTYYVRAYAININGTAYGDELSFTTDLGIGQTYQGGIIAYLLQPGDPGYDANTPHGIIVAPTDQSSGSGWGCIGTGTTMGATESGIGYGAANTTAIVNGCAEAGIAARICDDLVLNGYSDWYLPSIDELEQLYLNLYVNGIGGFNSAYYWSSTEDDAYGAWKFNFTNGDAYYSFKYDTYYVRAVRAF
jgi:hypothetical protein